MIIVNILAPVIVLVALGAALRASGFSNEAFFKQTNRLVYWVGVPALLFHKTATAVPDLGTAAHAALTLLAGMVAAIVLAYTTGQLLRLPRPQLASFMQAAYRGNLVYIGLPTVLYALDAAGNASPATEALALLAIAPLIPIYNITAVLVLLSANGPVQNSRLDQVTNLLRGVASNPLVLACVTGLAYAYLGPPLPLAVDRSLSAIGQMALPLALLGIGASLRVNAIQEGGFVALAAALLKLVASPLAGYLVARWLGLSGTEMLMALLYLTMPTAALSYVMADQLGADSQLASSAVVISTLLALPAISVVLVLST